MNLLNRFLFFLLRLIFDLKWQEAKVKACNERKQRSRIAMAVKKRQLLTETANQNRGLLRQSFHSKLSANKCVILHKQTQTNERWQNTFLRALYCPSSVKHKNQSKQTFGVMYDNSNSFFLNIYVSPTTNNGNNSIPKILKRLPLFRFSFFCFMLSQALELLLLYPHKFLFDNTQTK